MIRNLKDPHGELHLELGSYINITLDGKTEEYIVSSVWLEGESGVLQNTAIDPLLPKQIRIEIRNNKG